MSTNVAIVTGYSSGLGKAFAQSLRSRGWFVVGVSRALDAPGWAANDDGIRHCAGSVADDATVASAFEAAAQSGRLHLVVNCAGTGVFGDVGGYTASDVQAAVEGNLSGLILFSDRAVVAFNEHPGLIVNVMSTAAKKLRPAESVYTAVKWGAKAYTRTLREALKAQKSKTRVFEVYPCGMNTPFWKHAVRPVADGSGFPEPGPIADAVLNSILAASDSYQQEFTFERS